MTAHNHTDAPNFGHRTHRATRSGVALPLLAAGEKKFCPKSVKTTQNQSFFGCHSDFSVEPPGWILRFWDLTKNKDPAKMTHSIFDPTRRDFCCHEVIKHYSLTSPPHFRDPPFCTLIYESNPARP